MPDANGAALLRQMKMFYVTILLIVVATVSDTTASKGNVTCDAKKENVTAMSKDNLFFKKRIPLVIGHRGNPKEFQENTLAGFKSLLDLNVDGFETDILLTKDEKLVLYHDVNVFKLTGTNRNIPDMTYPDIQKLSIKKQLRYGNNIYNYTKTEKIPLLEDLLTEMKDSGLLMILEMKPSDPPYDLGVSRRTGIEVARMVKKFKLESQVVLSSFDPFKLYYARKEASRLNTCFLVTKKYWDNDNFITASMAYLSHLEGLSGCVENTTPANYGTFILESGAVVKSIGASGLDMDYDIFNNPGYSNDTFEMFKQNYGPTFSYGAWTIYKMKFSEQELDESEKAIDILIKNNAGRFYTDDAPRLLKKLGRPVGKNMGSNLKCFCISLYCTMFLFLTQS